MLPVGILSHNQKLLNLLSVKREDFLIISQKHDRFPRCLPQCSLVFIIIVAACFALPVKHMQLVHHI